MTSFLGVCDSLLTDMERTRSNFQDRVSIVNVRGADSHDYLLSNPMSFQTFCVNGVSHGQWAQR